MPRRICSAQQVWARSLEMTLTVTFDVPGSQSGATRQSAMVESFSTIADVWDRLLASQVNVFSDAELAYLNGHPSWRTAKTVLDVGCGNGDYVARLAENFPEKQFTGIEPSPGLLVRARSRHAGSGVHFSGGTLEQSNTSEVFDFVVLRFVVQHLTNPEAFFEAIRRVCDLKSVVMIVEPCVERSVAVPALVRFNELVQSYEMLCHDKKTSRAAVARDEIISETVSESWCIAGPEIIACSHTRCSWNAAELSSLFEGWITTLCDAVGSQSSAAARAEVADWLQNDGRTINIALKIWLLRPNCAAQ